MASGRQRDEKDSGERPGVPTVPGGNPDKSLERLLRVPLICLFLSYMCLWCWIGIIYIYRTINFVSIQCFSFKYYILRYIARSAPRRADEGRAFRRKRAGGEERF